MGLLNFSRNFNVSTNKILYYNLNRILESLNLTNEQWINFCILSGCDYCQRIPGLGIKTAYKYIKKYDTMESIFELVNDKLPENYVTRFNKAKDIFNKNDSSLEMDSLVIKKLPIEDETKLLQILQDNTNLTQKQIDNRLKIIKLI